MASGAFTIRQTSAVYTEHKMAEGTTNSIGDVGVAPLGNTASGDTSSYAKEGGQMKGENIPAVFRLSTPLCPLFE